MNHQVGDIVFAHSDGIMGKAIRFGERIRWHEHASHWNHAAIIHRVEPDGTAYVIQAEPTGVTLDKTLDTLGETLVVHPPQQVDISTLLAFAYAQVGDDYSFMSIGSAIFDIASPNWFPSLRMPNTWICSALVAEALRSGGWLHEWGDIYCVTPAQLYQALLH